MATIAFVTDLIFATKITGTGKALNRPVSVARSLVALHQQLDALPSGLPEVPLLIVDLNVTGPDPIAAISIARSHPAAPHIVAYLSHIQADLAQKARIAGAHEILARSAFVEKLPMILHSPIAKPPHLKLTTDPFTTLEFHTIGPARQAATDLLATCTKNGYSDSDLFAIQLALEEAFLNAFRHGNKSDPAKIVRLRFHITRSVATFIIEDQGEGFNPAQLPDPTDNQNLDKPGGRGILLMRAYMTSVTFNPTGNQVTMIKKRE